MSSSKAGSNAFSADELNTLSLWDAPDVSNGKSEDVEIEDTSSVILTVDDIEAMQKQAYQEAFVKGEKIGREEGKKEGIKQGYEESKHLVEAQVEKFIGLLKSLSEPFNQMDEEVESSIVHLSLLIAKQVIKRELKLNPEHIINVVKGGLKVLPVANKKVSITLHPDDAAILKESFPKDEKIDDWHFIEDSSITPGGCLLSTNVSQIDQTVEQRISEIITQVLDKDITEEAE